MMGGMGGEESRSSPPMLSVLRIPNEARYQYALEYTLGSTN